MVQADTAEREFTVKDIITLVAQDITSWSAFRMVVKDKPTDADAAALITKTLSSGIVKSDAINGVIRVTILPADTATLPYIERDYPADIQGIDPSGNTYTGIQFLLRVHPQVGRTSP